MQNTLRKISFTKGKKAKKTTAYTKMQPICGMIN